MAFTVSVDPGKSSLRSFWGVLAAAGVAVVGAPLLLSGGSLIDSANDALLPSSDQPASSSGQQANTDSQTTETLDIQSLDRAIRQSSGVEAVVNDVEFVVESHRRVYVEDELWGISAVLRLDEITSLDGPWITVDTGALIESATSESGLNITSDDYTVSTDTYLVDTEFIYVTIHPESGSILTLVPFEAPPNLWGGPVPKTSSEDGSAGSFGNVD